MFFLFACASSVEDSEKPAVVVDTEETGSAHTGGDTETTGGDSAESGDPPDSEETADTTTGDSGTDTGTAACPASEDTVHFVADRLTIADESVGVDFNGDGVVDNAVSAVAPLLDPQLAYFTQEYWQVLVLQVWALEDWCNDDVEIGIINADDMDGNAADNHTGIEPFDPGTDVDGAGHARASGDGTISGGRLDGGVDDGVLDLGFVRIVTSGTTHVSLEVGEAEVEGWVATSVAGADLEDALETLGVDSSFASLLLDLDTDGDGEADAMSGTFEVHAVPCTLDL